ncbi:MAG: transposase, partial [Kiritimatiellae bacterium]|nr:transposase [Kiritimatiellia bacterium]
MSNTKQADSGPAQGARRATEAGPESGRAGKGRWSARHKMSVILELLRGADLEATSRKHGVPAATLSQWREAFLAAGEEGLEVRQEDLADERAAEGSPSVQIRRWSTSCSRDRIRRMEDEKPFLRWRSN